MGLAAMLQTHNATPHLRLSRGWSYRSTAKPGSLRGCHPLAIIGPPPSIARGAALGRDAWRTRRGEHQGRLPDAPYNVACDYSWGTEVVVAAVRESWLAHERARKQARLIKWQLVHIILSTEDRPLSMREVSGGLRGSKPGRVASTFSLFTRPARDLGI